MDLTLTPAETRVLGSLLEKQRTVPATYPLTLNALVAACNQATSREPVMELTGAEVEAALERLKEHRLVRKVLPSHGSRTVKYRQVADEHFSLADDQVAVLTVLMLRGPQTPQELKTRTDRLHPFADAAAVGETLDDMARWGDPLVRLLPRGRGQRDARWAHLLAGEPPESDDAAPPARPTAAASATAPAGPPPDPAHHGALAALAGTWVGTGEGHYPTVDDFTFSVRVEVIPVPGRPRLAYRMSSTGPDGEPRHGESGFLRLIDDGSVELTVATGSGLAEVATGRAEPSPDGMSVALTTERIVGSPTAKEVTTAERTFTVTGDDLAHELSMAAVGEPMTHHLSARLRRA